MPTVGTFKETMLDAAPSSVDFENAIIYGIPYLGPTSPNTCSPRAEQRVYTKEVRKAQIGEANGKRCMVNHVDKKTGRVVTDRIGTWSNDRFDEDKDRSVADLHLIKAHPWTPYFLEMANSPIHRKGTGPSISARGPYRTDGTKEFVEAFEIQTIDLVDDPATVAGFFEGKNQMTTSLKDLWNKLTGHKETQVQAQKALAILSEQDAVMPIDASSGSPEEQMSSGFEAMIVAVFRDDSLDKGGKIAKIKKILDAEEKLTASDTPTASDTTAGDQTMTAAEAKQILDRITALETTLHEERQSRLVSQVCESNGRDLAKASPVLLEALKGAKDRAAIESLIEALPKMRASHRSTMFSESNKSEAPAAYVPPGLRKA